MAQAPSTVTPARGDPVQVLKRDAPEPLHSQISEQLRELIASGTWPPQHRVLPELQLAQQLGVARGTLRKAVKALVDEGLLVQVQGRGTFVTSGGLAGPVEHDMLSLAEAMSLHGIRADTELLARDRVTPSVHLAELLGLPSESTTHLIRLERLRSAEQIPVAYFINAVREDLCPNLDVDRVVTTSLYELIEESVGRRITAGRRSFEARGAELDMAERLEVPIGFPLQYFEQVTYLSDGRAVEASEVWVRSDRVRLTSVVTRAPDGLARQPVGDAGRGAGRQPRPG